jgi:hypothetical protein
MKFCIEIPNKILKLAEAVLLQSEEDESRVKKAVAKCKNKTVLIPDYIIEGNADESDLQQMYLCFAVLALKLKLDDEQK